MRTTLLHRTLAGVAGALATTAVLPSVGPAQTAYTSSAAFFAAIAGRPQTTETYESNAANSTLAPGTTLNGITYVAFPTGTLGRVDLGTFNSFGRQSLAASRPSTAPQGQFFFPGESITVSFAAPVFAFGLFFNATTASPAATFYVSTLVGSAASSGVYDQSTFYFVGLTSPTAFTSATFGATSTATSGYNVDNLTYVGAVVPEPSTYALVGPGLAGVGALVRRRRRASTV